MKTVLFACVHNAGRSQMAAALFNSMADPARAVAVSAGTQPGPRVHPEVVTVMGELGIDLGHVTPRLLSADLERSIDLLITMGCGETCPLIPGARREDWPLEDPRGKDLARVPQIREQIRHRVQALLHTHGWQR